MFYAFSWMVRRAVTWTSASSTQSCALEAPASILMAPIGVIVLQDLVLMLQVPNKMSFN